MNRTYKVDLDIELNLLCLTRAKSYRDLEHEATPTLTETKHRAY
jgi:hypothetical protein